MPKVLYKYVDGYTIRTENGITFKMKGEATAQQKRALNKYLELDDFKNEVFDLIPESWTLNEFDDLAENIVQENESIKSGPRSIWNSENNDVQSDIREEINKIIYSKDDSLDNIINPIKAVEMRDYSKDNRIRNMKTFYPRY